MRKKHTGQPLDYLFKKLNALFSDGATLEELNDLHDKASSFTPRSGYEIKDKSHLLQQINDLKDLIKELKK